MKLYHIKAETCVVAEHASEAAAYINDLNALNPNRTVVLDDLGVARAIEFMQKTGYDYDILRVYLSVMGLTDELMPHAIKALEEHVQDENVASAHTTDV